MGASSLLLVQTQGMGMAVAAGDGIAGEAKSHASHKMGMVVAAGDGIAGEAKAMQATRWRWWSL